MSRIRCRVVVDERPSPRTATLHLELGDVFRDARCFFAEFKSDNDFLEGTHGNLVGDGFGWLLRFGENRKIEEWIVVGHNSNFPHP